MEQVKRKVVLLGDGAVGKTSLVSRFVLDKFDDRYITTIGAKVMKKEVPLPSHEAEVTLMLWDVLGQKDFNRVQASSFQGAQGAILVFDKTRPETLDSIFDYWLPRIRDLSSTAPVVLAANKSDLASATSEEDVAKAAGRLSAPYFLTSAKTGLNVEEMFVRMAELVVFKGAVPPTPEPEKALSTLTHAADAIIDDFCKSYNDLEMAMPLVRQQTLKAGLDIKTPHAEGLRKLVDGMAEVERRMLGEEAVAANKRRRLGFLAAVEGGAKQ